jgi:hypothetical protein
MISIALMVVIILLFITVIHFDKEGETLIWVCLRKVP